MFSDTRAFSPLNAGDPFQLIINSVALEDSVLNAVASTGHKVEVSDGKFITVIFPLTGVARIETPDGDIVAERNEIILTSAVERMTVVSQSYLALALQVPRTLVRTAICDATDARRHIVKDTTLKHAIGTGPADPLVEFIEFVVDEFSRQASVGSDSRLRYATEKLLGDLVARALLADQNDDPWDDSQVMAAPWQAERAAAYIRSRYYDRLDLPEIAAAAGVGARALQLAFQKRFGVSPRAYLEGVRLAEVRRLLQSATTKTTVTQLALNSGFTHLGRFARFYCDKYGERPSDTLRRSVM